MRTPIACLSNCEVTNIVKKQKWSITVSNTKKSLRGWNNFEKKNIKWQYKCMLDSQKEIHKNRLVAHWNKGTKNVGILIQY